MKVFVTGSSSVIGTSLLAALASSIRCGRFRSANRHPIHRTVAWHISATTRAMWEAVTAAAGCDAGIHIAVRANDHNATEVMTVNVPGAYAFFRGATARLPQRSAGQSAPVHLPSAPNDNDDLRAPMPVTPTISAKSFRK